MSGEEGGEEGKVVIQVSTGELIMNGEDEAATNVSVNGWEVFQGREVFIPMPGTS